MNKKKDILDAAQPLFSQFGLKKVTTDDISRKSKVSKATIYKYFSNKYDIFHEVVQIETEQMMDMINKAVENESSVEEKLKAYLKKKINNIHKLINFYRVTRETWDEHWPYIAEYHESFFEYEKETVTKILNNGKNANELDMVDPTLSAHVLVVSLKSIEYPWALDNLGMTIEQMVDLMIDTFMNGVRKR